MDFDPTDLPGNVSRLGCVGCEDHCLAIQSALLHLQAKHPKRIQRGLLIGLSGVPGSGKTFFCRSLLSALQREYSACVLNYKSVLVENSRPSQLRKLLSELETLGKTGVIVIENYDQSAHFQHHQLIITEYIRRIRYEAPVLVIVIAQDINLSWLDIHCPVTLSCPARKIILDSMKVKSSESIAGLLNGYSFYDIRDLVASMGGNLENESLLLDYVRNNKPFMVRLLEAAGDIRASVDYSRYSLHQLGGIEETIEEVRHILIEPFERQKEYLERGIQMPTGLLLHGPSGTGKTHLAIALCHSTTLLSFLHIDASALRSKYLGDTEKRISGMFAQARSMAPCCIFLDHIDSLLTCRQQSSDDRIVTCFLMEMDGALKGGGDVVVLGVAEDISAIDPAILRPGRLGFHVHLDVPSSRDQVASVIRAILKDVANDLDAHDIEALSLDCQGLSQAEIKGVVMRAAQQAFMHKRAFVSRQDLKLHIN